MIRTTPMPPWPFFGPEEREAVDAVLASGKVNYWTGGEGKAFEREFADYLGVPHAIALANGTVALELALETFGIGPGDDVVTTCRTFIASASCAVMRGARPVMADVDPDSQNVTVETLEAALTPATKAIIVVHLAGWPADMPAIMAFAREHGLVVIEDCAQSLGAKIGDRYAGTFGDAAAFSFCQDKIITTAGEGGMLVLHDEARWKHAWAFKDHGKAYDTVYHQDHPPGFRWLHESFGTNMRMTELQAAVGRVAMRKLPGWLATRRRHAETLARRLGALPALRVPLPGEGLTHAWYKFYAFVRPERLADGWDRDAVIAAINAEGIPCIVGSCPEIYLEKAFPASWRPTTRLPAARSLGETALMFMVHPTLADQDIDDVATAVETVLARATRS